MSRPVLRTALLLALALVCAPRALAQRPGVAPPSAPIEIRGQVRFAEGGAPSANVVVRLENFGGGYIGEVVTDRSGRFRFARLSQGDYIVRVRHSGYKEVEQRVDLQRTSSDFVFLQLAPDNSFDLKARPVAAPVSMVDASVPADARREFEAGRDQVMSRKFEEGIAHLRRAVTAHPNFFEAYLLLGTAYLDTRQLEKSEAALRRALELKPKSGPALFALGETYREQKRYDEAEKALKEGLAVDDRSPEGHFTLGRVYFEKNDIPAAGREVGQALKLKPDFAEAHLLAGNLYLRARRADYALAEFQEYLRLAPDGEFAPQTRQLVAKIKAALAEKKK